MQRRRIEAIWHECRAEHGEGGPFLFGAFTAADAMYAPVVTRFDTYGGELAPVTRAYVDAILGTPAMREWYAGRRPRLCRSPARTSDRAEPAQSTLSSRWAGRLPIASNGAEFSP